MRSYVLQAVSAPAPSKRHLVRPARTTEVVLFGPASTLSRALEDALQKQGYSVCHLIPGRQTTRQDKTHFKLDTSSQDSVQALHALRGAAGDRVRTIIALPDAPQAKRSTEPREMSTEFDRAKALFLLCKVLGPRLSAAHEDTTPGWLIDVNSIDGNFGLTRRGEHCQQSAGSFGVTKAFALENPEVQVRCLDVAPDLSVDAVLERILAEWGWHEAGAEIGYTSTERFRLELTAQPVRPGSAGDLALDAESVVLITGGASGITAQIGTELARRYRPILVLVGRSPLPGDEADDLHALTDPAQIKSALIASARRKGEARPADIETTFRKILKDREIRANIAAMRDAGATVEYHALDVRQCDAFGKLIEQVYATHGRIDGVVHGAGIIDDKRIRSKTLASFEAVYDTKVKSAQVLARGLHPDSLKFVVFLSSISARFGNAGQCDYSAANEVLNKLANSLSGRWPQVQVTAINWGPWDAGMVNDSLRAMYAARNIRLIPPASGAAICLDQLQRGPGSAAEILVTASLQQLTEQIQRRPPARPATVPQTIRNAQEVLR